MSVCDCTAHVPFTMESIAVGIDNHWADDAGDPDAIRAACGDEEGRATPGLKFLNLIETRSFLNV